MKFVDEFRDGAVARGIAAAIATEVDPRRDYHIMEFCGGHTHAIARYGLEQMLPGNVVLIHGPGCPVCVLPMGRIDQAIALAYSPGVVLCSYGDMLRVPGSRRTSLLQAKAEGCDVRMMYSALDALTIARELPNRLVVFFAIGFESTTPPTASLIKQARALGLGNLIVFCNHVLTPAAIQNILDSPEVRTLGTVKLDGFIAPSHVSTVIGTLPYEFFAEEFQKPVVVAGFEPLDVLQSILMLVRQIDEGRYEVENQYRRAVSREGNKVAQALVAEVFELSRAFEWRGLGVVPYSALKIRKEWSPFDAEARFELASAPAPDHQACLCGAILRGAGKPVQCPLFGKACTPEHPIGSCMVSSEGACAAYHRNWRMREQACRATAGISSP